MYFILYLYMVWLLIYRGFRQSFQQLSTMIEVDYDGEAETTRKKNRLCEWLVVLGIQRQACP